MGVYLSKPRTEQELTSGTSPYFEYGAACMQGWRTSQEDAHCCHTKLSGSSKDSLGLFGVFDGHGGADVSRYCADEIARVLTSNACYKEGNIPKAFTEVFLSLDKSLLTDEVRSRLKALSATTKDAEDGSDDDDISGDEPEILKKEARTPVSELLSRIARRGNKGPGRRRGPPPEDAGPSSSSGNSSDRSAAKSKHKRHDESIPSSSDGNKNAEDSPEQSSSSKRMCLDADGQPETAQVDANEANSSEQDSSSASSSPAPACSRDLFKDTALKKMSAVAKSSSEDSDSDSNGSSSSDSSEEEEDSDEEDDSEEEEEADSSEEAENEFYRDLMLREEMIANIEDSGSDSENGDAGNGNGQGGGGSIMAENSNKPVKKSKNDEGKANGKVNGDAKDEEGEVYEVASEDVMTGDGHCVSRTRAFAYGARSCEDGPDLGFLSPPDENEPGVGSGTTAVVALLSLQESSDAKHNGNGNGSSENSANNGNDCCAIRIQIANAGDSRCIVCRGHGLPVVGTEDHKPEDEGELERITKAGGRVTLDGRVMGGLNLSRAIGDHLYKRRTKLPLEEQMVTSKPDVSSVSLTSDEVASGEAFMVMACDGIWNSMSNEEVAEFVSSRLNQMPLTQICSELFVNCLAPSTCGDGTGCDNMTAIIVRFRRAVSATDNAVNGTASSKVEAAT